MITFKPRLYQETILNTCKNNNTLIVLPTGLGKTKTAILVTLHRLSEYPESQVLFLTPTKPLASQIEKEYREATERNDIILFTGEIKPEKRKELAKKAKIIISTPQTISNDIINERINLKNISLIVLDEAHRCVGDYDYTWIVKQCQQRSNNLRIIGLTASPGTDKETIKEICNNAFIEAIEIRTEEAPDVKPHIQETDITTITVELTKELKEIQTHITKAYNEKIQLLKDLRIIDNTKLTKKELLTLMKKAQGQLARGVKDFTSMKAISIAAEAMKIQHALELVETQGPKSLYTYLNNIFESATKIKTKAVQNIVKNPDMHKALILSRERQQSKHPKLQKVKELMEKINKNDKTIIFNQYRENAQEIRDTINTIEGIKAKIFVGQTKKGGTGLTQKEQLKRIQEFIEGEINVIVATSIAEEGLDIPKVDNVIFYEPIPSAIRSIQRRGRTARQTSGKVIILMTKNTRDEAYHWVGYHKEKRMYNILKELQEFGFKGKRNEQTTVTEFKKENIKIKVDNREKGNTTTKELVNKGVSIETENLEIGDYLISERICIEKKSPQDFVNSIIDKRLIKQAMALRERFIKPLLIIEGEEDIYTIRNIHPNAIRGMLATLAIGFQIPIIYTKNANDTAELLITIAKQEQIKEKKEFPVRLERKPTTTKEMQEYIIESLPFIGPTKAKALLKEFKTIKKIINCTSEELQKTEQLGKKTAEEIQRIIHEEYNE